MKKEDLLDALRRVQAGETPEEVAESLMGLQELEREAEIDALEAARHGDGDLESDMWFDMNGYSDYDLNPGVQYNDGGEPIGYC